MRTLFKTHAILLVSVLMPFVACSNGDDAQSSEQQNTGSVLTREMERTYNAGINELSFKMAHTMSNGYQGAGFAFSPVTTASVLSMLSNGAEGETLTELLSAFGQEAGSTAGLNEFFRQMLNSKERQESSTTVNMANGLFVDRSLNIQPDFKDKVQTFYGAYSEGVDLSSDDAMDYINSWCSRQTEGKINDIISYPTDKDRAVLVSTVYFDAKWKVPFVESRTERQNFTREDGTVRECMMMNVTTDQAEYGEDDRMQALRMYYDDGDYSMTLLLPKTGHTVGELVADMSAATMDRLNVLLSRPADKLDIRVPRFRVETKESGSNTLSSFLKQMGVVSMFDSSAASFPGILTGGEPFYVTGLHQKTIVNVTEKGTEASSATAVGGSEGGSSQRSFSADHPFVFVVSRASTGVVYFFGTYHGEV